MKKTILFVFLMFTGTLFAQIVNVPDANFKNYLLNGFSSQQSVDTNNDGEIQVSEALAVNSLEINEHPTLTGDITSLVGIEAFTNLTYLRIYATVTDINLSGLSQLTSLEIMNNQTTSLNLTGLSNLQSLKLQFIPLAALDISNLSELEFLNLSNLFSLNTLTVGNNHNLYGVWVINCSSLLGLDLSGCPNLGFLNSSFDISNHDVFVNLKNGNPIHAPNSSAISFMNSFGGSHKLYVCLDEGELGNLYIQQNAVVSTYCTFTPGGNYNTIAGTLTYDADDNGCTQADLAGKNMKVAINDGSQSGSSITNATGNYNFYTQAGNFTLTPQFENNWFTATPATATVNFADNNNNTATKNFCIAPNGVHPDVEVVLVPVIGAQPGFDTYYKIIYKNKGNQTLSGNVVLNFDESILDYVSIGTTAPASTSSGQLTWAYSNLLPFESRTINVALNVNGPMETPPVNLDDVLNYSVSITPTAGDETPYDNTFTLNQIVTGSYDPNDITCLEGDTVHPDKIGEYLHYNINFENTGTAPATFIVVKDVINAQQYDINSLQMLHASHNVETRINGNKVEFFFDNINLGPLAKGNVVFKIKTKQTVSVNSTVMNKAEIFFDYNWPIVTNEAETTFALLSVGDFATDNSVTVFPNPAITHVTIKASSEIVSVQLYDMQGRLLMVTHDTTIDISNRASGIYFVKVMTDKGMKVEKVIRK